MKKIFALIFLFISSTASFSQEDLRVFSWEEVQGADADTIFGLSLEKLKLTELPAELARFTHLRILRIGKNKLTSLPQFLADFKDLEELDAGKNELEAFPLPLCSMPSIQRLILNRNSFERIPGCIENMKELRYIDVYDTPVTSLPESLVRLKKLQKMDFTGVRLSQQLQDNWKGLMPNVEFVFDLPCDCMN